MPFVLIIFLALFCLLEPSAWPNLLGLPPWASGLATWLLVALMAAWAWRTARDVRLALARQPGQREQALRRYERRRNGYQFALFGSYLVAMFLFGWGRAVGTFWTWGDAAPTALPGAELLVLAPFLAALVLSWVFFYDGDRASYLAIHQPLTLDPLARALLDQERPFPAGRTPVADASPGSAGASPSRPGQAAFRSRWAYVMARVRQNLVLVFIPVLLLIGQKELRRLVPEPAGNWDTVLTGGGFVLILGVLVCMPWIIRMGLGLKPLEAGALRDRLLATARRLRFRCGNVLVWHHSGMANAMVVGILPWPRYVIFTDRLLEDFTTEEVQAVFGHEVGHVKHHHMLYYLTFLMASLGVLGLLLCALVPSLSFEGPGSVPEYLRALAMMALLLAYVFVVFGFLSRRCERQADVYGCRAVSCPRPDCREHDGSTLHDPRSGPCPTGIGVFIRALEKVALVNGISRDRPGFLQSWQHSTIGRRVHFLRGMLGDPAVERRFQRRVLWVKVGLFAVLGVLLVVALLVANPDPGPAEDQPATPSTSPR
jgi:Zn-dependent protease with chaperone function